MKKFWIHRNATDFTTWLCSLFGLLALMMTGCNSMTDDGGVITPEEEEGDSILVQLRLSIQGSDADTRAVKEYYEEGTGIENYIDPSKVALWIADQSSKGGLIQGRIYATGVQKDPLRNNEYILTGYADFTNASNFNVNGGANQTVYVMVNTDDVDTPTPGTFVENFGIFLACDYGVYKYIEGDDNGNVTETYEPSKEKPIPMYGCHSIGQYTFTKRVNTVNDLGTITLLRAVSKVTIRGEGVDLSNVTLSCVYQYGFTCPYNMVQMNTTRSSSTNLNVPGVYRYYDSSQLTNGLTADYLVPKTILKNYPFKQVTDDSGTYWVAYVPEYNNKTTLTTNHATTGLRLLPLHSTEFHYYSTMTNSAKVGTDEEAIINFDMTYSEVLEDESGQGTTKSVTENHDVKFLNYTDKTTYYDLIRNVHYAFTVTKGALRYQVLDWDDEVAGEINFN